MKARLLVGEQAGDGLCNVNKPFFVGLMECVQLRTVHIDDRYHLASLDDGHDYLGA